MSSVMLDPGSLGQFVTDTVLDPGLRRATFAGPQRGQACAWIRVVVRPVQLRGEHWLQFSFFDSKKNITKNLRGAGAAEALRELADAGFASLHLATDAEEVDVRTTKKGKVFVGRRKVDAELPALDLSHNRTKEVPLPEGQAQPLLEAMGILTRSGSVRPTMRPKYTQINELLKQLTHVLDESDLRRLGRPVEILDCGCGASYLTLAAHYYLNHVLDMPAHILGVDVNEELIRKSIERSERLGSAHLAFSCGPIAAAQVKPDVVLALHACDTATDEAIGLAIAAEARILLSVPCCHHHLNDQLRATGPAEILRPVLRHGILHQRTADLVTDSFRALALRIMGYRTDIVEFISPEHTARNLMIRAVRGAAVGESAYVREYVEMRRFWGVTPFIEGVLGEVFQQALAKGAKG